MALLSSKITSQLPIGLTGATGPTGATGIQGASGATGTQGASGAGAPGATGALANWQRKTANYTAVAKDYIIADTVGGTWTLTLPASPSVGDSITLADGQSWLTTNLTVARNGALIEGVADDIVLNVPNVIITFIYDGTQWELYTNIGPAGAQGASGIGASGAASAVPGATGPQGNTGGASGPPGATGVQGASGATGAVDAVTAYQLAALGIGTSAFGATGSIRATNNITAYYSSDISLKENISDIHDALAKVLKIGGKTFDWTDKYIEEHGGLDEYFLPKNDFGVIAQDVQEVFPVAIRVRSDGTLAVDYEKLCALAFAAIKELNDKIDK